MLSCWLSVNSPYSIHLVLGYGRYGMDTLTYSNEPAALLALSTPHMRCRGTVVDSGTNTVSDLNMCSYDYCSDFVTVL